MCSSFKIENSKYNSALTYYIIGNSSELLSYLPSLLDKNIESRGLYSQGLGGNYIEDDDSAEIAGVLIESQQEIKNAIFYYGKAINVEPKNTFYLRLRGMLFKQIGKIDRAEDDFEKILEIDPNNETAKNFFKDL